MCATLTLNYKDLNSLSFRAIRVTKKTNSHPCRVVLLIKMTGSLLRLPGASDWGLEPSYVPLNPESLP